MPGSHGSLTKAGKVKHQTPKVDRKGINSHPKKIPRRKYREMYEKRIVKGDYGGQTESIGARRRFR